MWQQADKNTRFGYRGQYFLFGVCCGLVFLLLISAGYLFLQARKADKEFEILLEHIEELRQSNTAASGTPVRTKNEWLYNSVKNGIIEGYPVYNHIPDSGKKVSTNK